MDLDSSPNFSESDGDDQRDNFDDINEEDRSVEDVEDDEKERKKRSEWWAHYDEIVDDNGDRWAKCKHCDLG